MLLAPSVKFLQLGQIRRGIGRFGSMRASIGGHGKHK